MQNFGTLAYSKNEKISPHTYLLFAAISNPAEADLVDITSLAVYLDCFKHWEPRFNKIVEGLMEELFFALNPRNEEEAFFYWNMVRCLEQTVSERSQLQLLYLLRRRELT